MRFVYKSVKVKYVDVFLVCVSYCRHNFVRQVACEGNVILILYLSIMLFFFFFFFFFLFNTCVLYLYISFID